MSELMGRIIERWGFPVLVAMAAGWVLRNDVLLPLVEQHSMFLQTISETQKEISEAMRDQTRLLFELRPGMLSGEPPHAAGSN